MGQQDVRTARDKISVYKQKLSEADKAARKKDQEIGHANVEIQNLENKLTQKQNNLDNLNKKLSDYEHNIQKMRKDLQDLTSRADAATGEADYRKKKYEAQRGKVKSLQDEVSRLHKELDEREAALAGVEYAQKEKRKLLAKQNTLQDVINTKDGELVRKDSMIEQYLNDIKKRDRHIQSLMD